jgi:hypothetical protein
MDEHKKNTTNQPADSRISGAVKNQLDTWSLHFNQLPGKTKAIVLLTTGLAITLGSLWQIADAVSSTRPSTWDPGAITKPDIPHLPMETNQDSTELIPLGKMKGEIDNKFEAFYVAADRQGNFFINRNPAYTKERWNKSEDWKPISHNQLIEYEKHLHLIPIRGKSLTP